MIGELHTGLAFLCSEAGTNIMAVKYISAKVPCYLDKLRENFIGIFSGAVVGGMIGGSCDSLLNYEHFLLAHESNPAYPLAGAIIGAAGGLVLSLLKENQAEPGNRQDAHNLTHQG